MICPHCEQRRDLFTSVVGIFLKQRHVDPIANALFDLDRWLTHQANQMPRRAREVAKRMRAVAEVAYETGDIIVDIARDEE